MATSLEGLHSEISPKESPTDTIDSTKERANEGDSETHKDDTFTSEDGGESQVADEVHANEAKLKAKLKATPAIFKRRQATRHLVIQSPTDHIFSPVSQKLLNRKRADVIKPIDLNDEE